jgi:hypothetical protein
MPHHMHAVSKAVTTGCTSFRTEHSHKYNGAVLPFSSAPEGRGADGVDAMA